MRSLLESVKNLGLMFRFNPNTGIANFELKPALIVINRANLDVPTRRREFDRVSNQVPKNLAHADRIRPDMMDRRRKRDTHVQFFLNDIVANYLNGFAQRSVSIDRFQV